MANVLIISDTQAPFQHKKSIEFFKAVEQEFECNRVVHIGDEVDFQYLKYFNINAPHTPEQQMKLTEKFIHGLINEFPEMDLLESNHVQKRLKALSIQKMVPLFHLKTLREICPIPASWDWHKSLEIDGVTYVHGDGLAKSASSIDHIAKKALIKYQKSTVFGHFHSLLGIRYITTKSYHYFYMCVGCMIDENSYGMEYAEDNQPSALGCGVVLDGKIGIPISYEAIRNTKHWGKRLQSIRRASRA